MKKQLTAMTTTLLLTGTFPFTVEAEEITKTEENTTIENSESVIGEAQEQVIISSVTEIVEYDENQQFVAKTIIEEGKPMLPSFQSRVVVNEGVSMNYKLIDTFTSSSKVISSLSDWTYRFASAYIPEKFLKTPWSKAAATATLNALYKGTAIKYYTTKIYQAKDSMYYYGKAVSYEYSDSAKTKLTKTITHLSRVAK